MRSTTRRFRLADRRRLSLSVAAGAGSLLALVGVAAPAGAATADSGAPPAETRPAATSEPFAPDRFAALMHPAATALIPGPTSVPAPAPATAPATTPTTEAAAELIPASAPEPTHVSPLPGARISATFGATSARWATTHTGLDLAEPAGTPIHAAAAGTVVSAGWSGSYGNRVIVKHADGTSTTYNHMSRMATSSGNRVSADQTIGYVGSTGNSTGPHLHFEVMNSKGTYIDPLPWLRDKGVAV